MTTNQIPDIDEDYGAEQAHEDLCTAVCYLDPYSFECGNSGVSMAVEAPAGYTERNGCSEDIVGPLKAYVAAAYAIQETEGPAIEAAEKVMKVLGSTPPS